MTCTRQDHEKLSYVAFHIELAPSLQLKLVPVQEWQAQGSERYLEDDCDEVSDFGDDGGASQAV